MTIKFRSFQISDIPALASKANNEKVSANMTDEFPFPYGEENAKQFIERVKDLNPAQIFAIILDGELAGAVGIHPQSGIMRMNAEIGYWVAEEYWGRGVATKAIAYIVEYGFKTFDIDRIYARPYGTNKPSQRVLEKNGFVLEAHIKGNILKRGERLDELIYAIRKS